MEFDKSTIMVDTFVGLPFYEESRHRHLSSHVGYLSLGRNLPPGYPNYLMREVLTSTGRTPRDGAGVTLFGKVVINVYEPHYLFLDLCQRLWKPLPYEHERVQLWVDTCYSYMRGMSRDANGATVRGLTTPERNMAYLHVKKYYPEHTPDFERIAYPKVRPIGVWWRYYGHRPTPEECPGDSMIYPMGRKHAECKGECPMCM